MRLIDADAFDKMLIEAQAMCKKNGGNFRFGVLGNVRANLALFPAVDRPEIVRCKDCKFQQSRVFRIIDGKECNLCEMVKGYKPADWFCADGKRKNEDA